MSESQQSSPENDKKEKNKKNPRKRQVHNEVERRRKDKINGWIMKISELLPNSELQKSSKISILEQTVAYIQELVSERNKLLSENCSDVQEKEVKLLKKKVMFLETQNSLYVKLLEQAKISLTSLPKKLPKYSNKFTEENSRVLLKKMKLNSLSSTEKSLAPSIAPGNGKNSSDSPPSIPVTCSTVMATSTPCVAVSTNVTVTSFVQIQSKAQMPCVMTCQNATLNVTVSYDTRNASLVTGPTCMLESRTTLSAGGVTSALSPFPVMSSTLGSSFGNVYSRSIPTVIILPTGGGFVHPPLLSSNISVISPAVENVLPIIVPQQSHNVPTTSVVNILGPNGVNQIVSGVSHSLPTILSLPTSLNDSVMNNSLPSSSGEDPANSSLSMDTSSDTSMSVAEEAPVLLNPVTVASNTEISSSTPVYSSGSSKSSTSSSLTSTTTPSDYAVFTNAATTFSTPTLTKKTILCKPSDPQYSSDPQYPDNAPCENVNVQKTSAENLDSLESVTNSVAKECTRNAPPSLQALSANKIISLANKFQSQAQNSSLQPKKVSVECDSFICTDSVMLEKSPALPLNSHNSGTSNVTSSITESTSLVSDSISATCFEANRELCRNTTTTTLSSQENCEDSTTPDVVKADAPPLESFSLEECSTKSSEVVPTELNTMEASEKSDPKIMPVLGPSTEESYYFAQAATLAEKSSVLTDKFSTSPNENTPSRATESNCPVPQLNSSSLANSTQALLWSNNVLELETSNPILTKSGSELPQFSTVNSKDTTENEPVSDNLLNQSNKHPQVSMNVLQLKDVEKPGINFQCASSSEPSYVVTSKSSALQKSPLSGENPTYDTVSNIAVTKAQLNAEDIKYITSICNLNSAITSAAPSKCHASTTSSTSVNSSSSHLYSNLTYANNNNNITHSQSLETIPHPPVAWVRPTSHTLNHSDISLIKEKEQNTYSFPAPDYENSVTLHSVESSSCSTFSFERQKDKTSSLKNRSKSVKKTKPVLSSSSFNILPEVVTNIENFATTTGDVFRSAQALISDQRNNEHSNLVQKPETMNSASDILAKAAESIFGHDAFHTMEITAEEPSSQGSIMPYEVSTSYSNSDVFTHVLTSSDTSKSTNCGSYSASKFDDSHFESIESNKTKSSDKGNSCSNISNGSLSYNPNSTVYTRVRRADSNLENEPQAKKPRESLSTTSSSLSICPVVSSTLYTQRDGTTKFQTNISKKQTVNNGNTVSTELNNISRNVNSECLQTQQNNFYALSKKQAFNENQVGEPPLEMLPPHSVAIGVVPNVPRLYQSTISQAPCVHITHPVNNLFTNSMTINTKNSNKSAATQSKADSRRDCHAFLSGSDTGKQSASFITSSKDLNPLKSTISTSSDNIITSNHLAENSLSHFLSHSNTMVFPTMQNPNNQVAPLTNHFDLFNPQSSAVPIPHTKPPQVSSNVSQISELPSQLPHHLNSPHSMTQDTTSRVQAPFNPNLQSYRNLTATHTKTCVQPSVHSTSLSHSLCSLLKDTPSNTMSRDPIGNSNPFSAPSTSLPVSATVSSGVSKYSALSLISNQPCLATKQTGVSKSNTSPSSASQPVVSLCNKNSKSSLSYSAERLIQNQHPLNEKDKGKATSAPVTLMPNKALNSELYKPNNYVPAVSSEINLQNLARMPLPPTTSYPTFPPSFSMCDVRPTADVQTSSQYQDVSQNTTKDIFSQSSNFSVSPQVQSNSCTSQNMSNSMIPKSHPNLSLNFENSGTVYNSCNFLQPPIPNMDSGKASDGGACFPPIFVNSDYSQQPSKKNYCHFMNQMPSQTDTTVDKNFSIMPPIAPFSDKSVVHDHRQTHESSIAQNTSGYVSNIFYEPTSCTHESIGGSKPSNQRTSQEMYVPHRTKQTTSAQPPCVPSPLKTLSQNKGKTRKSKHVATDLNRTNVFNPSNCMNFNVFTVPDLSCGKSNLHHVPNNYKNTAQPVIPSIGDIPAQQGKLPETILGSVIPPHHAPFNAGLHQQNDLLNLNFQTPNYSGTPLTMHPPLTLSSCAPTPKTTRSFSSGLNPVPNFNLSNILPDMGCSTNDIGYSPIKFPPDCQPNSSSASVVLSAPHQTCASSLYTPHPSVVPNALPPLLNHTAHTLNRSRAPLPTSGSMPQPPHFSSSQTQPFQNIIHSLNFSRPDRQN